jgi:hypothetical protein
MYLIKLPTSWARQGRKVNSPIDAVGGIVSTIGSTTIKPT